MIEFDQGEEDVRAAPPWMATFADLMSLLLAFFVLLLSFSEMDLERYKTIAGSMKMAFGVQKQIKVDDTPKGTSIIAREFSPGRTIPTPTQQVQQVTQDTTRASLQVGTPEDTVSELNEEQTQALLEQKLAELERETAADAEHLRGILAEEISKQNVDIESEDRFITIRIREHGSFSSGSATLTEGFLPVMEKLGSALAEIPGKIVIEGHTDNVPISGGPFQSNWALSTSRALSVTHELLRHPFLEDERMMVVGYGDTRPYAENDTVEGRAGNRRVEIVVRQALDELEEYR